MANLTDVQAWAHEMMAHHITESGWSFGFDHAKMRAGLCDFKKKRISVSRYLAARYDDDEVRQILLHEIAHALAGSRAGHGPKWRTIAKQIGYDGKRTHDGSAANDLAPIVGYCPAGHEFFRFKRATRPLSCGRCSRGFNRDSLITWHRRDAL
jgi:predicted SprT family Zn-dependent metalloprotease